LNGKFDIKIKYFIFEENFKYMSDRTLHAKIDLLQSVELKKDLTLYIEFLLQKQFGNINPVKKIPKFGYAKGTFNLSLDFNEPLDDFKEYMPI
jgi:Protein of unknown function (DUF2281)